MFGGEAVADLCVGDRRLHDCRVDDERSGDGAHDALGAAAPAPLFDELDEARPFERPDVVVDLLTRQAQLVGELRR